MIVPNIRNLISIEFEFSRYFRSWVWAP